MARGTIKHLNPRGFGFIIPDHDHHDYFFHMSTVDDQVFAELSEGQRVEFEIGNDPEHQNRRRAVHVHAIDE